MGAFSEFGSRSGGERPLREHDLEACAVNACFDVEYLMQSRGFVGRYGLDCGLYAEKPSSLVWPVFIHRDQIALICSC